MNGASIAVDWYFDFISPFAYIALKRLATIDTYATIRPRPILFAGLLDHHKQLGPAEIDAKRRWTYRMAHWQAREAGLLLRFPAGHPFNPRPYLRMALACDCRRDVINIIFEQLWTTGEDAADPDVARALAERLGLTPDAIRQSAVKQALRTHTDQAIAAGVFGVPTLVINDELFWGADAIDFAAAYLADPSVIDNPDVRRLDALPIGVSRKR